MLRVVILLILMSACASAQDLPRGWAWAGMAYTTLERQAAPAPAPAPKPGGVCPTCQGTGKVGDGRVSQTCRDCEGTGKVIGRPVSAIQQKAADLFLEPTKMVQPIATTQPAQVQNCPGGVCPLPTKSAPTYTPPQPTTIRRGWIFRR